MNSFPPIIQPILPLEDKEINNNDNGTNKYKSKDTSIPVSNLNKKNKNHQHIHKLLISSNLIFDFHSDLKLRDMKEKMNECIIESEDMTHVKPVLLSCSPHEDFNYDASDTGSPKIYTTLDNALNNSDISQNENDDSDDPNWVNIPEDIDTSDTKNEHSDQDSQSENDDSSTQQNVIRSTMYEPVLDRCVTSTIIKPSRHPTDDFLINEYGEKNDLEPPPPERPPRRHGKIAKQNGSQETKAFSVKKYIEKK
ncbi:unnamed protein product [Diabrotica balteata]|uniref:Uncharacterized protein n=1 Tax=Diabrotica balteata TaxID=107213 RepID=A0A9N9T5P7_DIABA|nr:unnamed protein product [Diabrotica balteata]